MTVPEEKNIPHAAELLVHTGSPAGIVAAFSRKTDEPALWNLVSEALLHYVRRAGWLDAEAAGARWYACRVVTLPFLVYLQKRVPGALARGFYARAIEHVSSWSDEPDPDTWILVRQDLLCPLPRPCENATLARRLKFSLNRAEYISAPAEEIVSVLPEEEKPAAADGGENKSPAVKKEKKKRKGSPDEDKVMARLNEGWSVPDISREQKCSEAYIYKLLKKKKGMTAMEYRWQRWRFISDMYHRTPKMTVEEIIKATGVSRAQVYHAVRKVAERDNITLPESRHDRKLSDADVETIRGKLAAGKMRKDICAEYSITADTLIKYIGTEEDYAPLTDEIRDYAVRLRIQGKTLQQTADLLGISVPSVKRAWREKKNTAETKRKRVKYDNRNVLSKRDRDQAVNAVLKGGHTRIQIYTQYGINALTLRRYIRAAQEAETEKLRRKQERKEKKKKKDEE